jgi:hypothetical protein
MAPVPPETTWVGPAVIAACVSGLVAIVGFFVSTWTARRMHRERLDTDLKLAERKMEGDIALADRKLTADLALAERKVALDRVLGDWQRKATFAEEVLANCYEARDIIRNIRMGAYLGIYLGAREGDKNQTNNTPIRNDYSRLIERLNSETEFFAQLASKRYRFAISFGSDAIEPLFEFGSIYTSILASACRLQDPQNNKNRDEDEAVIGLEGRTMHANDDIESRLEEAIKAIEGTCQSVMQQRLE